ncbi:MAG: winged helix-turn-helix transcriptional regulator [Acidimicrobiales bacterium]
MNVMPAEPQPSPRPVSPLAEAVGRVGDRWALLLVHALLSGPRRFNDLQEDLDGIAPNVLTQRLRHLEREGVLVARPYSDRPPRVLYELTAAGLELAGALRLLAQWGAGRSGDEESEPLRHPTCGSALEARWWCPTCDRVVDDAEGDELRFL